MPPEKVQSNLICLKLDNVLRKNLLIGKKTHTHSHIHTIGCFWNSHSISAPRFRALIVSTLMVASGVLEQTKKMVQSTIFLARAPIKRVHWMHLLPRWLVNATLRHQVRNHNLFWLLLLCFVVWFCCNEFEIFKLIPFVWFTVWFCLFAAHV